MERIRITLRPGDRGLDVHARKRAIARALGGGRLARLEGRRQGETPAQAKRRRETFQRSYVGDVKLAQRLAGIPMSGVMGPELDEWLLEHGHFDALALELDRRYAEEWKREHETRLIEPRQGWTSLHPSLWTVYSVGRGRFGLTDLGTYNPASRLPGGGLSDHAVFPAMAIDFGIDPDTGWNHLMGRAFVLWAVGRPEVEYAILGDRIYFGRFSWHRYTAGGHMNHVHVSGNR